MFSKNIDLRRPEQSKWKFHNPIMRSREIAGDGEGVGRPAGRQTQILVMQRASGDIRK